MSAARIQQLASVIDWPRPDSEGEFDFSDQIYAVRHLLKMLREPTDEEIEAGREGYFSGGPVGIFQDMIDEILEE